jgi:RHS repeat-associated protein
MTKAGNTNLTWDKNGQLVSSNDGSLVTSHVYNWDGKLRSAAIGANSISLKYDPAGNRIQKNSTVNGNRKYVVDIIGELPTILLELDPNMEVRKTYIYADSQILAQHNGSYSAPRYFYLHDRLGSVRLLIDTAGVVKNSYTYNAFGESFPTECNEAVSNPFKFSGQFFDDETGEYYLRNRQYEPVLMRFTSIDPADGKFDEPMTLHKYLYCGNNPINRIEPAGEWAVTQGYSINATEGRGGATITIQYFYGMSDDLTFFGGYMLTIAGGPEPTGRLGLSGSLSGVAGYSPNAQSPEDLGGLFFEVGGSAGLGFSGGGNWAVSPTGIQIQTISYGFGSGTEIHGQMSHTFIFGDVTIGPSMHERKMSPFEQKLTALVGKWGSAWLR